MSGRRYSPPPPPRESGGGSSTSTSNYRKGDDRRLPRYDEPSSSRRRSPSPHSKSGRRDERDWRRNDTDRSRHSHGSYRDSRREGVREDRYSDRPPRARPEDYDRSLQGRDRRYALADHDRRYGSDGSIRERRRSRSPQPPTSSSALRSGDDASRLTPVHDSRHSSHFNGETHDLEEGEAPEADSTGAQTMSVYDEDVGRGEEGEGEEEEEDAMAALMGFGGFGTTKGRKVAGNEAGAAEIKKERTWRQYMNRKGGFNRPLDKIK